MLGYSLLCHQTMGAPVARVVRWFGRYLRDEGGVTDKAKVFHSFRHTVKDALRRAALTMRYVRTL